MANCCRIFVKGNLKEVQNQVSHNVAIKRFGENPIRKATDSYFGSVRKDLLDCIEINLMNDLLGVCREISKNPNLEIITMQDLDGYGHGVYFSYNR